MIITFCGHADYTPSEKDERKLLEFLEQKIGDRSAELYLGDYGNFDRFAFRCGKIYQRTHPNVKLRFVSPYLSDSYQKNRLKEKEVEYDGIIFPPIESIPPKFAILHRNRWIVDQADYVIARVTRSWGGARQTLEYAKKQKKDIFEL